VGSTVLDISSLPSCFVLPKLEDSPARVIHEDVEPAGSGMATSFPASLPRAEHPQAHLLPCRSRAY
jgi:hypothetical protein